MDRGALERNSYHAVVRALFASGRLQSSPWETELLLTDLQEALGISEHERLVILQQVEQDAEALHLATFPESSSQQPMATTSAPAVPMMMAVAPTAAYVTPQVAVESYSRPAVVQDGGYYPPATSLVPVSRSKVKKAPSTAAAAWKPQTGKKLKSGSGTPSTPKAQTKGSSKSADKRSAAVRAAEKAQLELDRLNVREREIFETLVALGVQDDDPELNNVQRTLLQWYRMDLQQRDLERQLFG